MYVIKPKRSVLGLKILGRVDIRFFIFFSGKNIILCILKGVSLFKMDRIKFLTKKPVGI